MRERVLEIFRGYTDRFAERQERDGGADGAFDGTIIMLCRQERMNELAIEGFDARKVIGVTKHGAKIGERVIGAFAGHAEHANGSVPSFGEIYENFFEIVMLLIGDFNNLTWEIFLFMKMVEGFRRDGIEIADDGIYADTEFSGMFCSAIGAESERCAIGSFDSRNFIAQGTSQQDQRKIFIRHGNITWMAPKVSKNKKPGVYIPAL